MHDYGLLCMRLESTDWIIKTAMYSYVAPSDWYILYCKLIHIKLLNMYISEINSLSSFIRKTRRTTTPHIASVQTRQQGTFITIYCINIYILDHVNL